jgi:tripartite-type tricarboxylate transporter receptor subunit TctC
LAAAVLSQLALPAAGQDNFPSKPITLVVPYPPGGSNDVFARSMAKELVDVFKQPVIVDNRAGASGSTGTALVARAPADGYTLVAVSSSMTTHAALHAATPAKLPFDPVKDFTPVALLAQGPFIVAVAKLNAAINQVLSKPAIQTQFLNEGAQATAMSPTQFAALIAADIARWKQLARQQHIVAE